MPLGPRTDQTVDFGAMQMVRGRAFAMGHRDREAPVGKAWLLLDGRQFLVEEVAVADVAASLDELPEPPPVSLKPRNNSVRHIVSSKRLLPEPPLAKVSGNVMHVPRLSSPAHGVVLDYLTINSAQTNFTFKADTTYYISGSVNLNGVTTIEGGTVIKYAPTNSASVTCLGPVNSLSAPYRPAIFTARDDNSVGETIAGSTGTPTGYYATNALCLNGGTSITMQNLLDQLNVD